MQPNKYTNVREHIRSLIEERDVGDPLPPERALSQELGVSRMTLRRAVDDLVRDGYLVREQGRGTFVAERKIDQTLSVTSFTEDMRARGMVPGSRTVEVDHVHAGARLGRRLRISPDEKVMRVQRVRLADGDPMAIETLHVAESLVPGLTGEDLERQSFYELLRERYGVRLVGATQTIEPTVTDEEESGLLDVPVHSPAFLFERTSRDERGRIVEFVRSLYRGDRYQITTQLQAGGASGSADATTSADVPS